MKQTTIQKTVRCKGVGLHQGKQVELVLNPAPEDTGIMFCLQNGAGKSFLTPKPHLVVETTLATVLGNGQDTVATVEHLMAAVRGMGIDNIRIEVSGAELPIMDGSAGSFVYLLKQAGVRRQSADRRYYRIAKPVNFEDDGRYIKAEPHNGFFVDYTIEFDHPLIGRQNLALEITPQVFEREVAKARTFGFLREVEYLHANGLALGGSLDNAVVLDEYGIVNDDGLRHEDEFVRHKILDFIGDMAIMGLPLQGKFEVYASGHQLNNQFTRCLQDNFEDYLEESLPEAQGERRKEEAIEVPAGAQPAMA